MRTGPALHAILQTFLSRSYIQAGCASPSLWKFPVSQSPESSTRSSAGWARTQTPELSSSSPMRTTSGERRGMLMSHDRPFINCFSLRLIFPLLQFCCANITLHLRLFFPSLSSVVNDVYTWNSLLLQLRLMVSYVYQEKKRFPFSFFPQMKVSSSCTPVQQVWLVTVSLPPMWGHKRSAYKSFPLIKLNTLH